VERGARCFSRARRSPCGFSACGSFRIRFSTVRTGCCQTKVVELGLSDFYTVQKKTIIGANGTVFVFAGLRHHISKIKSFEGADIVWVEEGQNVSKQSYDVLIPTIRKPGSEIWVTFNPDLEEDEVYQRFIVWPRPDARVQKMNWNDNAWLPEELRKEKDHLKARDLEAYDNVWEGHCRSHVAGALWTKEVFAENRDIWARTRRTMPMQESGGSRN
jgi:phage terminase large subunit